jgi:Fe-S oxidoreductase
MTITITLSPAASKIVQDRINNQSYPDAQTVVEAALSVLELDDWMANVVLPTLELNCADPARSLGSDETFSYLRQSIVGAAKASAA